MCVGASGGGICAATDDAMHAFAASSRLPDDMYLHIVTFIDSLSTVSRLRGTCRHMYALVPYLTWLNLYVHKASTFFRYVCTSPHAYDMLALLAAEHATLGSCAPCFNWFSGELYALVYDIRSSAVLCNLARATGSAEAIYAMSCDENDNQHTNDNDGGSGDDKDDDGRYASSPPLPTDRFWQVSTFRVKIPLDVVFSIYDLAPPAKRNAARKRFWQHMIQGRRSFWQENLTPVMYDSIAECIDVDALSSMNPWWSLVYARLVCYVARQGRPLPQLLRPEHEIMLVEKLVPHSNYVAKLLRYEGQHENAFLCRLVDACCDVHMLCLCDRRILRHTWIHERLMTRHPDDIALRAFVYREEDEDDSSAFLTLSKLNTVVEYIALRCYWNHIKTVRDIDEFFLHGGLRYAQISYMVKGKTLAYLVVCDALLAAENEKTLGDCLGLTFSSRCIRSYLSGAAASQPSKKLHALGDHDDDDWQQRGIVAKNLFSIMSNNSDATTVVYFDSVCQYLQQPFLAALEFPKVLRAYIDDTMDTDLQPADDGIWTYVHACVIAYHWKPHAFLHMVLRLGVYMSDPSETMTFNCCVFYVLVQTACLTFDMNRIAEILHHVHSSGYTCVLRSMHRHAMSVVFHELSTEQLLKLAGALRSYISPSDEQNLLCLSHMYQCHHPQTTASLVTAMFGPPDNNSDTQLYFFINDYYYRTHIGKSPRSALVIHESGITTLLASWYSVERYSDSMLRIYTEAMEHGNTDALNDFIFGSYFPLYNILTMGRHTSKLPLSMGESMARLLAMMFNSCPWSASSYNTNDNQFYHQTWRDRGYQYFVYIIMARAYPLLRYVCAETLLAWMRRLCRIMHERTYELVGSILDAVLPDTLAVIARYPGIELPPPSSLILESSPRLLYARWQTRADGVSWFAHLTRKLTTMC